MKELEDRELYKQTLKKQFLEGKEMNEETLNELKEYLKVKMEEYDSDNG